MLPQGFQGVAWVNGGEGGGGIKKLENRLLYRQPPQSSAANRQSDEAKLGNREARAPASIKSSCLLCSQCRFDGRSFRPCFF